jgi:hypothetical protein
MGSMIKEEDGGRWRADFEGFERMGFERMGVGRWEMRR